MNENEMPVDDDDEENHDNFELGASA